MPSNEEGEQDDIELNRKRSATYEAYLGRAGGEAAIMFSLQADHVTRLWLRQLRNIVPNFCT